MNGLIIRAAKFFFVKLKQKYTQGKKRKTIEPLFFVAK